MSQNKPFFTPTLFAILIAAGLASAGITYWFRQPPAKPPNPTQKNPNVKQLKAETMEQWRKKSRLSPEHSYVARKVFPYISKNQKPIKNCYFGYRGKEKLPFKTGARVTVKFNVRKDGTVTGVGIFRSQLKVKSIHQCIMTAMKKWKFPIHHLKKPVDIQYPFFFR